MGAQARGHDGTRMQTESKQALLFKQALLCAQLLGQGNRRQDISGLGLAVCLPSVVGLALLLTHSLAQDSFDYAGTASKARTLKL